MPAAMMHGGGGVLLMMTTKIASQEPNKKQYKISSWEIHDCDAVEKTVVVAAAAVTMKCAWNTQEGQGGGDSLDITRTCSLLSAAMGAAIFCITAAPHLWPSRLRRTAWGAACSLRISCSSSSRVSSLKPGCLDSAISSLPFSQLQLCWPKST